MAFAHAVTAFDAQQILVSIIDRREEGRAAACAVDRAAAAYKRGSLSHSLFRWWRYASI